jgi:phage terminase small subunit
MSAKLTAKQARFVEEYMIDLNAKQAAIRAGYSPKTAAAIAEKLLKKPQVAKAIKAAMDERSERTAITAERVLDELARVAFADLSKAFREDGTLKALHEMDRDTRRAIVSLEVTALHGEEGVKIGTLSKIKLGDKLRALELLGRHLGMFNDKLTIAADAENPLQVILKLAQGTALKPVHLHTVPDRRAA